MSRQRHGAAQLYALLRFTCPDRHTVGQALLQPPEVDVSITYGAGWVRMPVGDLDGTMRFRCAVCEGRGKLADLQASAAKVLERLREIDADPTRGTEVYPLGG